MVKKKRIAKILAGMATAALCVTGAVNYWAFHATDIVDTAEIGTYAAGTKDEEWEAANDSFTAAGEAVKRAAEDAAAEKNAATESTEEAETVQTAQTSQKPKQTTQSMQQAVPQQSTSQESAPAPAETPAATPTTQPVQSEQATQPAQPTSQPAQSAAPTPEYCGHCGAVFYSESEVIAHVLAEHSASTPAPTPAPAPQPQTTAYVCGYCGAKFYNESESSAHLQTHTTPDPNGPTHVCACGFKGTLDEVFAHQDEYPMGEGHDSWGSL